MTLQHPETTAGRSFPQWKWRDLVYILFGIGAIFLAGGILIGIVLYARGADVRNLTPTVAMSLALAALEALALTLAVYFFGMRRRKVTWTGIGLRPFSAGWLIVTLVLTSIAIPLTGLITILVMLAFDLPMDNSQLKFLLPEGLSPWQASAMFLLVGLAIPFAEELVFRGVLYPLMRFKWGIWVAILGSSLVFGIVHGDFAVGLTAFLLGILLAVVYEFSGSLWTAIIIHAVNNSSKIALLYLLILLGYEF